MITLEKYRGKKTRYTCPKCHKPYQFTRYIDTETGKYFSDEVGKCNRVSCGYHYTPRQFFAENPTKQFKPKPKKRIIQTYAEPVKTISFIDESHLIESVSDYLNNNFAKGLLVLFPNDVDFIKSLLELYFVGTYPDRNGNLVAFWQVDKLGNIRTAKLMRYDFETLKRQSVFEWTNKETGELEKIGTYWIHSELQKKELIKDFQVETVFFGEHLLTQFPDKKVAIVEAEKTAIICSIVFRDLLPDYIWLSAGSAGMLQVDRLKRIGKREIILFPDTNAFELWTKKANEANKIGLSVMVSDLLETDLSAKDREKGLDLADFLINEQRENLRNFQISRDSINSEIPTEEQTIMKIEKTDRLGFCGKCKTQLYVERNQWFCPKNCR